MPLTAATRLGHYEILSQLGVGGMGEVYRARDTKLDRIVAIKVLPPAMAKDADALTRFEREAKAVAALSHPNILAIFEFGTEGGVAFATMELLEGESLRSRLAGGPLPPRKAIEYALQVCQGLGAAHDKGVVHRDLKPENLFITKDNRLKILDFGLAKVMPVCTNDRETMDLTPPTEPGTVMGTVGYMSPEQVRGEEVDERSDIFAVGSLLYEMLSGKRAFKADSAVETMSAILRHEPPELEATNRNINPALERIVRHCLEKQREARFQSARDLAFQLESLSASSTAATAQHLRALPGDTRGRRLTWPVLGVGAALGLALAAALGFFAGRARTPVAAVSYQQLTFQRGAISAARIAPDGKTILYSAAWNGTPMDVLSTRSDSPESRSLELPSAGLLAVSSSGELAIAVACEFAQSGCRGTLARVPLSGGAPRELLKDVAEADWTPDGKDLAVIVRDADGRYRLEFPVGKVLYEAPGWISHVRVSPRGDALAFFDHPVRGDDGGSVVVVDLAGKRRTLSETWDSAWGLAWHPSGDEIWFTAAATGRIQSLRAVTLTGKTRVVLQTPARLVIEDMSRGGVLLAHEATRGGMMSLSAAAPKEIDLAWFDWATAAHLSADGKSLLFGERGEGTRGTPTVYLRGTDGSAAVKLGEGRPLALSPDGEWALALASSSQKLVLLPTGAGAARDLPAQPLVRFVRASWFPRSKRVLLLGNEPDHSRRCYVMDLDGGTPRPVGPEGAAVDFSGNPVSPDEKQFAATGKDGQIGLYPLAGGAPRVLAGLPQGAVPIQWSPDGKALYVSQRDAFPARVFRVDIGSGTADLWKEILPLDRTGIVRIPSIEISPDGKAYVYTFTQRLSELYLAEGLR
jgi:eukaryotic-like serine/threonine-protein kinase